MELSFINILFEVSFLHRSNTVPKHQQTWLEVSQAVGACNLVIPDAGYGY